MWMIVGLGNPGAKYALTRHNVGFIALDAFATSLQAMTWQEQSKAHINKFRLEDKQVLLVKPLTFMNLSGQSVQALMEYYKVDISNLLVIQDDIDQEFGKLRFHFDRGHGGHNGIRNISELLGTAAYARLKIGVGRPTNPHMDVASYVLEKFNASEEAEIPSLMNRVGDAIESFVFDGFESAANKFN